jgi:L-amino acid N-acyltransferase YncA
MIDVCGQLSFHIENEIEIDAKRLMHLRDVFACYLYVLETKGIHHLDTWIPPEMEKEIRFAESFGFQKTGYDKIISYVDGREQVLTELRIKF